MATANIINGTPCFTEIGPFHYEIGFDADASYDYGFLGACLYRSKRIKLDPRQSDTHVPQTLLHEILHALGNAYEIDAWEKHVLNDKQQVTDKLDLMATAFLQWLKTNPEIVAWLQTAHGRA